MVRTLLTGATGTLGTHLVPRLRERGHDVRAASRSPPAGGAESPSDETNAGNHTGGDDSADGGDGTVEWVAMDLAEGTGIREAVADVDVVVHAASAPRGDSEAVDVRGTETLCAAAADAGVSNLVYVSIVGVDEIPYSYYEHKLTAENIVEASAVPSTIVRITQFHEFVHDLLETVARLPVWPLPTKFELQPIAVAEAAAEVVDLASPDADGRVPPVGGPDVRTAGDLARAYRDVRGLRRPIVRLPLPGGVARGFRSGAACCPDRPVGRVTWTEWLSRRE